MYNTINTEHVITVITWWIKDLESKGKLPEGFASHAVISAMRIIMTNSIFEFRDMFFLQLLTPLNYNGDISYGHVGYIVLCLP